VLKDVKDYYGILELADPNLLQYPKITVRHLNSLLSHTDTAAMHADILLLQDIISSVIGERQGIT
jgi:hypothetical protein